MKEIKLTRNQIALVDDEDYPILIKSKWQALKKKTGGFYAVRTTSINGIHICIRMHRFVLGVTNSKIQVDHRDRNELNNQKSNLRIANHSQNATNSSKRRNSTSKYKGVTLVKIDKMWRANICKNGKTEYLGKFKREECAALAYNKAAKRLHGEFANINKIEKKAAHK